MTTHFKRHLLMAGVASCIGFCGLTGASAQVLNPGFESSPDFANWTTFGAASIQTASYGSGPTEGVKDALLTNDSTSGAVSVSTLESDLGFSSGTLTALGKGAVTNGSAIQSAAPFNAAAGQKLSFDWDFLTNELDPLLNAKHNDFVFWAISGTPTVLADVNTGAFLTPLGNSGSLDYLDETGFVHSPPTSFTIPTTGTYSLIFGVVNVGVSDTASGLLVDNIQLTSPTPPNGTPEPGSLALVMALGAGGFVGLRRSRRA